MRFSYREIPDGVAGTDATVQEMNDLVATALRKPAIRLLALKIVREAHIRARDFDGEIKAIFDWVKNNIRYTRDPHKVEMVHSPEIVVRLKAGDCDDMSLLLAALLQSLGHRTRFKVISSIDAHQFNHIYTQVRRGSQWISLDPTVEGATPGWESPRIYRSKTYSTEGEMRGLGDDGPDITAAEKVAETARAGPGGTLYVQAEEILPHVIAFMRGDMKDALVMRQVGRREIVNQLEYLMSPRASDELSPVQIQAAITVLSEAIRYIDAHPNYRVDVTIKGLAGLHDLGFDLFDSIGTAFKKVGGFIDKNVRLETGQSPDRIVVENPTGSKADAPQVKIDTGSKIPTAALIGGGGLLAMIGLAMVMRKKGRRR